MPGLPSCAMKKIILSYVIGLSLLFMGSQLLLGCNPWELPARKTQRNCVKPAGNLDVLIQQKQVNFSVSSSSGTIDQVLWDFGNGSTTITSGLTATYTYPAANTYTVKATLSNACGIETTLLRTVIVSDASVPTVSLQPAVDISTNSATLGMTVTSTGNANLTRYGVIYSTTNQMPEIGKSDVTVIDKSGSVVVNTPISFVLINLQPNALYYVRSFATNLAGPGYSTPVQTFRTGSKPAVNITGTLSAGITNASVNFVVMSAGSPAAIEYGICYSSSNPEPGVTNSTVIPVASPTVGMNTTVNLINLVSNVKYYYRSYAKLASGEIIYSTTTGSFTTQIDTLEQDLIASLSFTDGSRFDVSGNNNHANLVNGPTFTTDRKGKANSAILLDGQNDYFSMAENSTLRPANLSISIWIKPTTVGRIMQIYNKSQFSDGTQEMYSSLIRPNTGGTGVVINTDIKQNGNCQPGIGWQTFSFTSSIQLNIWHHVVMTYSGRSARMYFDNALLFSKDDLPKNTIDECPGGDLKFGAQSQALPNYFFGAMDDVRIYRKALSLSEVQALFNKEN